MTTFEFHGLLEPAALAELHAGVALARAAGGAVRVVLRAGAEVDRACVADLRALDAEIVAEPAYLARWLADAGR